MNPTALIVSAVAACLLGWWLGTNHVEGKWAKADKAALELQEQLDADAARKRKEAEDELAAVNKRLAENETKLLDISAQLNEEINREPTIAIRTIEVPGECEEVRVVATDPAAFVRLFNAAITATTSELRDSLTTGTSAHSLWRAGYDEPVVSVFGNH